MRWDYTRRNGPALPTAQIFTKPVPIKLAAAYCALADYRPIYTPTHAPKPDFTACNPI
jgi:hypothetical protein